MNGGDWVSCGLRNVSAVRIDVLGDASDIESYRLGTEDRAVTAGLYCGSGSELGTE